MTKPTIISIKRPEESILTVSQSTAYALIIDFIKSNNKKFFRLSGYAGTGKSFLIARVIKYIKKSQNKWKFTLASPTNKAARNLQSICLEEGIETKVTTVAKLLGIQPEINIDTGEQEFLANDNGSIESYDIVFIDEFSMIDKATVETIFKQSNTSKVKIIFVGDDAQLPPINERISLVATHPAIKDEAVLKEVVRYEGEIAKVAEEIRSEAKYNTLDYPFITSSDETIFKLSQKDWLNKALELFEEDLESARIIAWRNKTVDNYNKIVRQALYGNEVEDYIMGDILIAKSPVFRKDNDKKIIIFNTSDELTVTGQKKLKTKKFLKQEWEYYEVPVNGGKRPLLILTPFAEKTRETMLKTIKEKALTETRNFSVSGKRTQLWSKEFYPLLEAFDNISYGYSCTCHKAQGSSIPNVFLDVMDLRGCSDKQKILYTGLTRAKKTCYVN